jgi:hypothetical protein
MPHRKNIFLAAVAVLSIACISSEALAWRAAGVRVGGVYRDGAVAWRGGAYAGRYVAPGVGIAAVTGVAVGAAMTAPYYARPACGYYPYPPCY